MKRTNPIVILIVVLAAALAAWLRGAWLGSPILAIFVLVMVLTLALALNIWQALSILISTRQAILG